MVLAREFGAQPLERDLFAAERELAAHAAAGADRRAQLGSRPCSQAASALGSDESISAGPVKVTPASPSARWPLSRACVKPGARNSKRLEIPAMGVGADVAAQVLHHPAGERELIDADADLHRNDRTEGAARQLGELAQRCAGRGARCGIAAERAVEIDLPAGQHAFEARRLAEFQIGDAGQFDAMLLRAVEEIDVLDQHGGRARLDLAAQPPGLPYRFAAGRAQTGRPRQAEGAFEARRAAVESAACRRFRN